MSAPQIQLSDDQTRALYLIREWLQRHRNAPCGFDETCPHFYLGGLAGTGKSTLVKYLLAEFAPEDRNNVLTMTPTGKAADVLRNKGIPDACTVHSAIYSPISPMQQRIEDLRLLLRKEQWRSPQEKDGWEEELGELLRRDTGFAKGGREFVQTKTLFICDEFSMVGRSMYQDILHFRKPLLAIGDPGQLAPVKDQKPPFGPDYVLTEIHRQAEGNPIIKLAYEARRNGRVEIGQYGESRVIGPDVYTEQELLDHDQVICFTHDVRRHVNNLFRVRAGKLDPYPMVGEKLVCKKNQPDLRLFNGAMYVAASGSRKHRIMPEIFCDVHNGVETLELPIYPTPFDEYRRVVKDHEKLSYNERRNLSEFDFGYVITGHASQGSEWDSVLVIDETYKMRGRDQMAEWLYTAITRAAKRVTVYKPRG